MLPVESLVVLSAASLVGLALLSGLAAWAWHGWLRLRADELAQRRGDYPAVGQRIDLADLKERIRKLEAIAAGVDF